MRYHEIAKLLKEFEKYDSYTRDYDAPTTKPQRFIGYLSRLQRVIDELQQILENNHVETASKDSISITEHEIKTLNTAITYYFRLERRAAASA